MGAFLAHSDDRNATAQALREAFPAEEIGRAPEAKIPFSSQRKWSAVTFPGLGTIAVGAPERMTGAVLSEELQADLQRGRRVLLAAYTAEAVHPDYPLPRMIPLAALVLSDPIRAGAVDTLSYFQREGVAVKVLSGDNPAAAAAVAAQAGLARADAWVDMSRIHILRRSWRMLPPGIPSLAAFRHSRSASWSAPSRPRDIG